MAYKSVSQTRDSVSGILQGLNLNNVKNLNIALERAARKLAQKIFLQSAEGRQNITLYDGVIDYAGVDNIFGTNVIDIKPQGITRSYLDEVYKAPQELFDQEKNFLPNGTEIAFEYRQGTPIMRIVSTLPMPRIELDPLNDTTGWTAAGSASGLTKDSTVYYEAPASLRFTLTGASTGTLTKAISSQDLTDYVGVGVVFLAFRTPSASDLTSFTIRLGSDSTNYYSVSSTTGFLGAWTAGDWLLVALDLSGATTTGTPTVTAIDYAQISIVHAATLTNFYVGDLWIALPSPATVIYESPAIFKATGTSPSSTITLTSDQVLLTDNALAIYELFAAIEVARQQGGSQASPMIQDINEQLNGNNREPGLLELYRAANPSESLRTIGSWYN